MYFTCALQGFGQLMQEELPSHFGTAVGESLSSECAECRSDMSGTLSMSDQARASRYQSLCTLRGHLERCVLTLAQSDDSPVHVLAAAKTYPFIYKPTPWRG